MAQPAQNTGGNRNGGFNWIRLISTLVILGLFVLFGLWISGTFNRREALKTSADVERVITESKSSGTDEYYIENIRTDEMAQMIYVDYHNPEGNKTLSASVPRSYLNSLQERIDAHDLDSSFKDKSVSLQGTNPPRDRSWIWSLISMFLPILLMVGLFYWISRRAGSSGGAGGLLGNPGKNQAQKIISKKRFSDVAGQKEVKEEIEEVVDFLKNPKKYKAAGARIPKGILLGGPPGTGKTLLAKATAGEAGVPFYFISASNFVEMFAGVGAKRVREMFKEARKAAPAILFIDELDAVGRKRGSALSGNDEREQTLNQILVEMDGMEENAGLLIIAATNRPDVLDPALQRPGRFDRTITVNNPDIKERELILELHAKGKRIAKNVDFANIAKRTTGYSGAQLENVINEATLLSVREKTGVITLAQIDEAIDRVMAGPAKKHRVITEEEKKMVAYHEAGHAVIGLKVANAEQVQKITIIPRGQAGGYTLMTPKKETYNFKKSELEAKIISYMGGRAAEQIIYGAGEVSTGAHNDIQRATNIARAMVTQYGMSILGPIAYEQEQGPQFLGQDQRSKDYSDALAERIDEAIRELVTTAEKKAIETIKKHKKLLGLIVDELMEKETIVIEEIEYINKNLKRPPKKAKLKIQDDTKSLKDIISEVKSEKK